MSAKCTFIVFFEDVRSVHVDPIFRGKEDYEYYQITGKG